MKFVSMFIGLLACAVSANSQVDLMVEQAKEGGLRVMNTIVEARKASGIPLRKRDAYGLRDRNGNKFQKVIPFDLDRRYDEAAFNVYDRRLRKGFMIPRQSAVEQDECMDTPLFGTILGFAYGLQYNRKVRGVCYEDIETSIMALDTLVQEFYLVFLPWEWGTLMITLQDFVDVASALYSKCQIQEFLGQMTMLLTYEGFGGLITRTYFALQSEIPLLYEKSVDTTRTCIKGESYGKIAQIVFDYSI